MSFRLVMFLGFLPTLASMAFAYYLQYFQGLEPCPLCIFQRIAMITAGLIFLLGFLHGPVGPARWIYALFAFAASTAGAAIAGRHVWLQSLPADQVPACGPDLDYLLDILPWQQVVTKILRGDASCASIDASFIGLSLPGWTAVAFVALALWAILGTALVKNSHTH